MNAVERTTKIATTVLTLPEAWSFVMQHIDQVGNRPNIHIAPISFGDGDDCFEVAVSGMAVDA